MSLNVENTGSHTPFLKSEDGHPFDRVLWERLCSQGLFENFTANLLKTLSRETLDIPLMISVIAHQIGISILKKFGTDAQKNLYLKRLQRGESLIAVANSEIGAGTELKKMKSKFVLNPTSSEIGSVTIQKNAANNLPLADLVLTSVWVLSEDQKPQIEVLIFDSKYPLTKTASDLSGFKTGLVGGVSLDETQASLTELRVGTAGSGKQILKKCYDLERAWILVILSGVLEGLFDEAKSFLKQRENEGNPIHTHQYVQEKLLKIFSAKENLKFPADAVIRGEELNSAQLSHLKNFAVSQTLSAARSFYELQGSQGYEKENLSLTIERDCMGLIHLGGTTEQHKINIFREIFDT